ncbi:hypothetical protein Btru_054587 [Bulinus truncatus]|nr:hypothetical protein Btru_054587 [Bulinus truncatus]
MRTAAPDQKFQACAWLTCNENRCSRSVRSSKLVSGDKADLQCLKMTKPKNKIEPNERLSREDTIADLLEVTNTVNTPPLNHKASVPTVEINAASDKDQRKTPKLLNEKEERSKLKLEVDRIKKETSLQSTGAPKNTLVWKDKNGDLFTNLSTETNTEVECSDVLESFYFDRPDLIIRIIGQLHHDGSSLSDHQEFPDLEYCLSYTGIVKRKGGIHLLPGELQRRVINLVNDTGAWIVTSYEDHDVLESARQPYVMPVKVEPEFFPEASVWPPSYTYSALHLAYKQTAAKTEGLKPDSPYECILVSDCDRKDLDNLLQIINRSEAAIVILRGSGYLTDILADAVSTSGDLDGLNKVISKLNQFPNTSSVATKIQKEDIEKLCKKAVVFEQKLTYPDLGIAEVISEALLKVKPRKITLLKLFVYLDAFDLADREYQDLAVTFVNACYDRDPETTLKMITRKMERFNDESCIDLAMSSKNLDFLEQPACVTVQRRVWNWGYLWEHYADNMNKLDTVEAESVSQTSKRNVWTMFKKDWLRYLQSLFAPVTMFSLNGLGLLIFIFAFALTLLGRLEQSTFHWLEGYLMVNVFFLLMEEINEIYDTKGNRLLYLANGWNQVDILSIVLFIIGAAVRIIAFFNSNNTFLFDLARIALCVDFIVFTLRLLHNCYSNQVLGPTCSMIIKTVSVLMKFLYILAVFWVSYAVASEAILYPNSVLNSYTIFYLLRKAYWQMFGQLFLDEMDAGKTTDPNSLSCTDDKNKYATYLELRCPTSLGRYFAPILMAVYMMFVNILLFNLITATFTKSIEKIQVQADKLWRFQFFELTRDFSSTLFLPLPFTPVSLLARLVNESKKDEDGLSMYPGKLSDKAMKKETHVDFKMLETSLRNKWLDGENISKRRIQESVAKTLRLLESKVKKELKDKVIEHILPQILETVKLIFNEIEKYLIKDKIVQDIQVALNLVDLNDFRDRLLDKLIVILQEADLKNLKLLINDSDELWNKEYDGLLAEIINFSQEKDILLEIQNKIEEFNKFDWKLSDQVHVTETQKSVTKTLKDMEEIAKKLKFIKLPHKTKLEDRRAQRIRGISRRIKDLINLMSHIPVQSYTYNRFYAQLQKKIHALLAVVSSLQFAYIQDEFMNDINDVTHVLSVEKKTKVFLETEAKIKDLEMYVLQNHIEPKVQKKNLSAVERITKSEDKTRDLEARDFLNQHEPKIQKKYLEMKDAIESSPSTDNEIHEDDLSDVIWVPMFSDSKVKVNNDDSTTFVHEPENLTAITFNNIDKKRNIDRRSYSGKYDLENGKPVNPLWNQNGEGEDLKLKRWGPNHYGVLVITRIKHKGNKIVRKDSKVELEFLVRKKKFSRQYVFPQVPCSPNQDPFTEFMRPKAAYVKKVLKKHEDSLKNIGILLMAYKAVRGFRNAEKALSVNRNDQDNQPNGSPSKSTKIIENGDKNKPKSSPQATSKTWNTIRGWFKKSKKPEPLSYVRKSPLQVKDCQKTKTVFIGIDEEKMSKHKWKEIRVINYHNPNAENQSKLETDLDLEWVDSTKYKEIKDIMKKDIVKFVCGLHDAFTDRRGNSAMLIKSFR